jgi:hypothetical protein
MKEASIETTDEEGNDRQQTKPTRYDLCLPGPTIVKAAYCQGYLKFRPFDNYLPSVITARINHLPNTATTIETLLTSHQDSPSCVSVSWNTCSKLSTANDSQDI